MWANKEKCPFSEVCFRQRFEGRRERTGKNKIRKWNPKDLGQLGKGTRISKVVGRKKEQTGNIWCPYKALPRTNWVGGHQHGHVHGTILLFLFNPVDIPPVVSPSHRLTQDLRAYVDRNDQSLLKTSEKKAAERFGRYKIKKPLKQWGLDLTINPDKPSRGCPIQYRGHKTFNKRLEFHDI